ncbi:MULTISPECIES: hypothetical protein [unclassified Fibrobacter]|uniref:hypothetical protein n=1 Tax=unclassified Fibrobacter TaxID=2634177 RepID=UPI0025BCC3AB|nr:MULTISPECIES: hypothetical protein [unclassified Fibrobacter]
MRFVFLGLMLVLVFGKVRYLQDALGFGGEVVNIPPKIILIVILFGIFLRAIHGKRLINFSLTEKLMFVAFGLFIACGSLSSVFSDEHMKLYPQIMDVVNYSSFILGFYGTICYFQDTPKERLKEWLEPTIFFVKGLTVATLLFWFLEQAFGLGMTSHDAAHRLFPPYEFIYYHGTYLITVVAFSFLLLYKERNLYTFILCALCLLSARDRGYMFLLLFIAFAIVYRSNTFNIKLFIPLLFLIGIIAGAISYQKILYYTDDDSIRATFYVVATMLALKYNPLGAGWCTIGTWNAYRYNSPVFSDYYYYFLWADERDSVYGDSGFSSIIGQTGFAGTICYLLFMILLFFAISQKFTGNKKLRMVVSCWLIFNIVSFFISDSMVSNFSIISSFFMGILYLTQKEDPDEPKAPAQGDDGKTVPELENMAEGESASDEN